MIREYRVVLGLGCNYAPVPPELWCRITKNILSDSLNRVSGLGFEVLGFGFKV